MSSRTKLLTKKYKDGNKLKKLVSYRPTYAQWIDQYRYQQSDYCILARWFLTSDPTKRVASKNGLLRIMKKCECSKFLLDTFVKS